MLVTRLFSIVGDSIIPLVTVSDIAVYCSPLLHNPAVWGADHLSLKWNSFWSPQSEVHWYKLITHKHFHTCSARAIRALLVWETSTFFSNLCTFPFRLQLVQSQNCTSWIQSHKPACGLVFPGLKNYPMELSGVKLGPLGVRETGRLQLPCSVNALCSSLRLHWYSRRSKIAPYLLGKALLFSLRAFTYSCEPYSISSSQT